MKHPKFIFIILLALSGCVQPSSNKTVVVKLHVEGIKNIQMVGVRGKDKPLSWDADLPLYPIQEDTLYTATFSLVTGYTFTEVKFTVNGQFELTEADNRKITFSNTDTTVYEAWFDAAGNNVNQVPAQQ